MTILHKKVVLSLLGLFVLVIVFIIIDYRKMHDGLLHVSVFDVGQGDGILIKSPHGNSILIDGGPSNEIVYAIAHELSFYRKNLDVVIVSHPHADHITGLIEILKRYSISHFYFHDQNYDSVEIHTLMETMNDYDIYSNSMYINDIYKIDDISLYILWPDKNYVCENINNCSVVIRLTYKDFCMYFMGDATSDVQDIITKDNNLQHCPIVKIAHQGAKDGVSSLFMNEIKPQVGIISVGENNYGHPAIETLDLFNQLDIIPLRTDKEGSIKIITDGIDWEIY